MKILLSWIDPEKDFKSDGVFQVETNGPHAVFYREFIEGYSVHMLLVPDVREALKAGDAAAMQIRQKFSFIRAYIEREIEERELSIKLQIQYLKLESAELLRSEIIALLNSIYEEFSGSQIEVFTDPKMPFTQEVWNVVADQMKIDLFEIHKEKGSQVFKKRYSLIKNAIDNSHGINNIAEPILSKELQRIYDQAKNIAEHAHARVLILGETGTGKELIFNHILKHSIRLRTSKKNKYFSLNCAAFTSEILMSELFGHEKGAFTSAEKEKVGYFEAANNGILFLDEIGDISPLTQVALLRVIEYGEFQKVGSTKTQFTDVQVIAATNRKLFEKVKKREFREDLYYRLSICEIHTVPFRKLSEKEKITAFNEMLKRESLKREFEKKYWTEGALKLLINYDFPGNFRELSNMVEGIYVQVRERDIVPEHLPQRVLQAKESQSDLTDLTVAKHFQVVYEKTGGNLKKTAELVNKSPNTVKKYLKLLKQKL